MFESISNWRSRLFGGPAAAQLVAAPSFAQEWVSLDLDPELTTCGDRWKSCTPVEAPSVTPETIDDDAFSPCIASACAPAVQPPAGSIELALSGLELMECGDNNEADHSVALNFALRDVPEPAPAIDSPSVDVAFAVALEFLAPATARLVKPRSKKATTGKSGAAVKRALRDQPTSLPAKPARLRGMDWSSPWKLPGVDGYESQTADDSVERVTLEFSGLSAGG